MPRARTWLWILGIIAGLGMITLIVVAVVGMRFVANHVKTSPATSVEAQRAFDDAKAVFKEQRPLIEIDALEQTSLTQTLSQLPTADTKPTDLWILVWSDRDDRLVRISLPFWLLRLGRRKVDIGGRAGFDLERLKLDMNELSRVGSRLVLDHRTPSGERILMWTQ